MLQTDPFGGLPELAVPDFIWQAECSHGVKLGGAGEAVDPASGNGGTIYPQNLAQARPLPAHLLPLALPAGCRRQGYESRAGCFLRPRANVHLAAGAAHTHPSTRNLCRLSRRQQHLMMRWLGAWHQK